MKQLFIQLKSWYVMELSVRDALIILLSIAILVGALSIGVIINNIFETKNKQRLQLEHLKQTEQTLITSKDSKLRGLYA